MEASPVASPKRRSADDPFQDVYPYYAGFPEAFVSSILSANFVRPGALVYDPWNGSGTTTAVAAKLGFRAVGYDLNPAMVVVAKARLLPQSESSSLQSLAMAIISKARAYRLELPEDDPLRVWFQPRTASVVRSLERACSDLLITAELNWTVDRLSCIGAVFLSSLFSVCRKRIAGFRTANPTWIREPAKPKRAQAKREDIESDLLSAVTAIGAIALETGSTLNRGACLVAVNDATCASPPEPANLTITSPPYCTRIDYAMGSKLELALLWRLTKVSAADLRQGMIGTTVVPAREILQKAEWGRTCNAFLQRVEAHPSKASSGYYYRTHLDYFDKMYRSISKIASATAADGRAVMVVQDSFYKDVHNDLAGIVAEMSEAFGLHLQSRTEFKSATCMSRVNSRAAAHQLRDGSTESVLLFAKSNY